MVVDRRRRHADLLGDQLRRRTAREEPLQIAVPYHLDIIGQDDYAPHRYIPRLIRVIIPAFAISASSDETTFTHSEPSRGVSNPASSMIPTTSPFVNIAGSRPSRRAASNSRTITILPDPTCNEAHGSAG